MLSRRPGTAPSWCARRSLPALTAGMLLLAASAASAQTTLPPVSLGAGLQTSFVHTAPDGGDSTQRVLVNSARFYVSGPVTDKIKFMFNTEYNGADNTIGVLDAAAQISTSEKMNIWFGRFLPPSDRANLYGPYYSSHWSVYTDGIQDGYPFAAVGRDNGVMYWGQFSKLKISAGIFDGPTTTGNSELLVAARAQVDLWDPEGGYYLNGTYYGGKNLLAIGGAVQAQDGNTAANVDFLLEKKVGNGGAFTIESQYNTYDALGGYDADYAKSHGGYILAAYLFPKPMGIGKVQLLGKFAQAKFTKGLTLLDPDYKWTTTEINFNYVIKEFNARLMFFFRNQNFDAVRQDNNQVGVGLQIQM